MEKSDSWESRIALNLLSFDPEIVGDSWDVYHEPELNNFRLEDRGIAYQGDDRKAYRVAIIDDGRLEMR